MTHIRTRKICTRENIPGNFTQLLFLMKCTKSKCTQWRTDAQEHPNQIQMNLPAARFGACCFLLGILARRLCVYIRNLK